MLVKNKEGTPSRGPKAKFLGIFFKRPVDWISMLEEVLSRGPMVEERVPDQRKTGLGDRKFGLTWSLPGGRSPCAFGIGFES